MTCATFADQDRRLLERTRETVQAAEPGAQIILYGSRARGDADWESDWDLLVLLDGRVDAPRKQAVHNHLNELSLETGEVLSALIVSEEDWRSPRWRVAPIHANIEDEGIDLATMEPAHELGSTQCTETAMAEARDELVQEWLTRAHNSLTAAETLADAGLRHESVSRLYYACFDAVRAMLLQRGYRFSKHSSVQSLFNREFVKTGSVPVDLGDLYNLLFKSRGDADYEPFVRFVDRQVRTWIADVGRFVCFIETLLSPGRDEAPGPQA